MTKVYEDLLESALVNGLWGREAHTWATVMVVLNTGHKDDVPDHMIETASWALDRPEAARGLLASLES